MIDWKLHLIFGCLFVILWLNVLYFFKIQLNMEDIITLVVLTLFLSLLPDLDLRKSKIREFVSSVSAFTISLFYILTFRSVWYYGLLFFLILYSIFRYLPTKHRGLSHTFKFSLTFSLFISLLFYFLLKLSLVESLFWFVIIFSSYSFHLILDRL
jgi:membrane-bound metal-dependent hydrolase YbcI (DUF457 family)